MKIELLPPVKNVFVTQPFGVNYVGFYRSMGLNGHNGTDFKANSGYPVYAAHSGLCTYAGIDGDGGKSVTITENTKGNSYKTIYYHLNDWVAQKGIKVRAGQLIGYAGNTGKYTTGAHLHFGLKEVYDGNTINKTNGYLGALNPADYMPKNWDKSRAYHRYGRERNYWQEVKVRFKNPWLHRQLKKYNKLYKIYDNEFINALVYGGWSFEDVMNESLYFDGWGYLKKDEFTRGIKPFG